MNPTILYKYCSFTTATSIIGNGALRLYRSSVMNDPTEITFGFDIYLDELSSALDRVGNDSQRKRLGSLIIDAFAVFNQHHDARFSTELLEKCGLPSNLANMEHYIRRYGMPDEERYRAVYMTCFSSNSDDLTQWRSYAKDATGLCIGFKRTDLSGLFMNKPKGGKAKIQLSSVYYGKESAQRYFRRMIDIAAAGGTEIWPLAEKCYKRIVVSKHECYKSESEWRMFIYAKALKTAPRVDVTGSRPRPYLEMTKFRNGEKLPVKELWSGPTSAFQCDNDEGWKMFVAQHLESDKLESISFRSSNLPYAIT